MRIPYFPLHLGKQGTVPPNLQASTKHAIETTLARRALRGSASFLALDLALLHSPPILSGWNALLGALRDQANLPKEIREFVMCRVAALNRSVFEWGQHAPLLRSELTRIFDGDPSRVDRAVRAVLEAPDGAFFAPGRLELVSGSGLSPRYLAVLAFTDAMTSDIDVPQEIWDQMRRHFPDDRDVVELVTTCAVYNCVSRFLVALDVGEVRKWSLDKARQSEGRVGDVGGIAKAKL